MCRRIKLLLPFLTLISILAAVIIWSFNHSTFLNQNNGLITLIFAFVVAVATAVYAYLTWLLVDETKEMRKAQTEPNISITIEPREDWINFMDMKIMNIGSGPAYDIKFETTPDFECFKGKFLSKIKIMQGIKYLAPNQKIQFFLTSLTEDFEEKIKNPFAIKVTYKNKLDEKFTESFAIDFSQFEGMLQLGEPPLYKIANAVEDIKRNIGHLSTGVHRIKAIVYTKKDIDNEHKEMINRIKKQKEKPTPSVRPES